MDYHRIRQQLTSNLYPLTRICKTMQQLEGLKYETTLDLNMGYYTISILPASQETTTIFTEFGKFRYNRLPMGMCSSGDIFQAKVDKLLGDIECFKTYIDDILVLSKEIFCKHTEQLNTIFGRLRALGLKLNAPK